tara:strand:- start:752 stop:880 length:129 start_codon:yes stop_codon:yes gene_type:complete
VKRGELEEIDTTKENAYFINQRFSGLSVYAFITDNLLLVGNL